jgi:CheY-like chemotaxis protein
MSQSAVVIGASELLDALQTSAGVGGALAFPDTQPLQALQAITEQRPALVVLERLFAATSRGAALINRIKSDPALAQTEIRVLSHTGDYARVIARPAAAEAPAPAAAVGKGGAAPAAAVAPPVNQAPAGETPRPLDWHGTRRAPRVKVRDGVEMQIDGDAAVLVDISVIGAQVLSTASLRPNQRVRIALPQDDGPVRFRASVAWAKFELPKSGGAPKYRAGLEFVDADEAAITRYFERVKL